MLMRHCGAWPIARGRDIFPKHLIHYYLGKIKDKRAIEPLLLALKDKEWYVRWKAAEALGKFRDKRTIAPLMELSKNDTNESVRSAAEESLRKIRIENIQ